MRSFKIIAELENVSKAAELLHTSQSALSKTVLTMENELGMKLFDRKGKKLVLNEAGMRFLDSCNLILEENDAAIRDLRSMTYGSNNTIRLCMEGIYPKLFQCMSEFKNAYPQTEYVIDSIQEDAELPNINKYDVIIYPDERRFAKYKGSSFYEERFLFAVPTGHPLAEKASAPIKDLNGLDFVFMKKNDRTEYPYHVCNSLTIDMKSSSFASSRAAHKEMISAGVAAGFVPAGYLKLYQSDPRIKLLPVLDSRFERKMNICFKREKHLSELADAFKKFVILYFKLSV